MEDPILLGILMFGFLVTSALCHNFVELLQDINQGDEADEVSEHHIHGHQAKF